jgi:hypothetical protein
MKKRLEFALAALLLAAGTLPAAEVQPVLTPDGTVYTVASNGESHRLEVSRRKGETRETLVVPATVDDAVETDARLLWDSPTSTLFVVWHSAADRDAIVAATLKDGAWSGPIEVSDSPEGRHAGLDALLTHAPAGDDGGVATLLHAVWWDVADSGVTAQYALVAFEGGENVSAVVERLDALSGTGTSGSDELEEDGGALHPPLALAFAGTSVDVVYGKQASTKITRVRIDPRRVVSEARLWRPSGRTGVRTGPARLVTADSAPVKAFISKGRVVLYRPDAQFRYVVLENGEWSPERMIQLDEKLTSEQLLRELHRTVDDQGGDDTQGTEQ